LETVGLLKAVRE